MSKLKPCPEFLDAKSPKNLEVYRIATENDRSGIVYPDRSCFLASGRSMLFNTEDGPHLCHLDDGYALEPLGDFLRDAKGVQMAPDGRHLVFRAAEPENSDVLTLRRLDLQTGEIDEIFAAEGPIPGTECPVRTLSLEAVSYDGSRVAGLAYLDYGRKEQGETGIVALNPETGEPEVVASLPFCLSHLRYFPGSEWPYCRWLMVQHHHGKSVDKQGKMLRTVWDPDDRGVDLHVLRDDGTEWMDLPFGRDGEESCIGHQLWRHPYPEVAAIMFQNQDNSCGWAEGTRQHVVSGAPIPSDPDGEHRGRVGRDEHRHLLSHNLQDSRLCHLGVDGTGLRFAFDTFPVWNGQRAGMALYIGSSDAVATPLTFRYLLNSGVVFKPYTSHFHAHPILSPDGRELFFSSDYFGTRQAYVVKNLPWP